MGAEPKSPAVVPEMVEQELARILDDPLFVQSQRLTVLLRFLVENCLAGRASELKEFVIGAEAFERGPHFDPQVDNVVRVNAARLRSRLAEYYLGRGAGDPVIIALPKGAYVPTFTAGRLAPAAPGIATSHDSPPSEPVGRIKELTVLRTAFESVSSGQSSMLAITGEAGIGKTTLTDAFLFDLQRLPLPAWVLRGRCSQRLSKTEPFVPIFECLEELMRSGYGSEVRRVMQTTAPAWLARLESTAESSGRESSAERFRRELVRFLRSMSQTRPVVMFLDDLQWVDESTVDLLSYITSHIDDQRLLLLTAYRPSATLSAHPFLSLKLTLQRQGLCRELPVGPFSLDDVRTYIDRFFPGNRLDREFFSEVQERTEGHPLFICEMLRFLLDLEVVRMGVEGWHLADDVSAIRRLIPSGVQDMIRLEITQMADADRRILECAAVQGVEFTSSVVAKATGTDAAHTEERLAQLAGAYRFIESAGESDVPGEPVAVRFRFAHVLYQNVLYADIAPTRRASLSLSVAAALIGSRAETALGAATGTALLLESGRDNEGASRYFLLAARRAIAVFAYPEATLLCQRGLENLLLVPESIRRDGRELEFCLIFGLALMVTRGYAAPEVERVHRRSRELCLRLHQRKYLVRVLWGLHTCLVNAGELVPSLRLAEEMEEAASSRNDHEAMIQALHARGTTLAFMGRTAEARVALEEAIRLLDSMKHVSRRSLYILDAGVTCMSMLARVLARMGKQDEALEQARMSQTIADRLEHAPSVAYATFWVGWVHHARGEFSEAAGYLATAFDLSRKYGLPQFLEWSRIVRGSCLCHLGTPVEGIAEMRLSLENQLSMNCLLERPFCLNLLAEALLATGARDEALRCCDEALEISKRTEGRSYEVETREIREWALAELVRTA